MFSSSQKKFGLKSGYLSMEGMITMIHLNPTSPAIDAHIKKSLKENTPACLKIVVKFSMTQHHLENTNRLMGKNIMCVL